MPGGASRSVDYWAKAPSPGSRVIHAWWEDAVVCKPGLDLPTPTATTYKRDAPPPRRACRLCLARLDMEARDDA